MAFVEVQDIELDSLPGETPITGNFVEVKDIELDEPTSTSADPRPRSIFQPPRNAQEQEAMKQQFNDIGSSFTDTMRDRGANLADISYAGATGEQSDLETVAQAGLSTTAGTAFDIIGEIGGEAVKNIYRLLPDSVEGVISEGGENLLETKVGQTGLKALESGVKAWENFKEEHPRAARNIEAVTLAVGGYTNVGGKSVMGVTKDVTKTSSEALTKAAKSFKEGAKKGDILNSEQMRDLASKAYDEVKELGEVLPADQIRGSYIEALEKFKPSPEVDGVANKDINKLLKQAKLREGEELDFDALQQLDELLTEKISKRYRQGLDKTGGKLMEVQDALRESVAKTETGGKLSEARKLWAASKKLEDIEKIMQRASNSDNKAAALKKGFEALANNNKRMRGYSPEERKLIEKAAKSGKVSNALRRIVGNRFISIGFGAAMGGSAGAAVGLGASSAAKGAAAGMNRRMGEKIRREISKTGKGPTLGVLNDNER